MRGRLRGVSVSNASVLLAEKNPNRSSISFSVGESSNACSVVIKDSIAATTSNGVPLTLGMLLVFEGEIATHQFNAIRLAAVDCVVGVVEGFPDSSTQLVEGDAPVSGVPSL